MVRRKISPAWAKDRARCYGQPCTRKGAAKGTLPMVDGAQEDLDCIANKTTSDTNLDAVLQASPLLDHPFVGVMALRVRALTPTGMGFIHQR